MKLNGLNLFCLFIFFSGSVFSQVEMDKPLEMTGGTGERRVTQLESPVQPHHAANKHYVDSLFGTLASGVPTMNFTLQANKSSLTTVSGGNTSHDVVLLSVKYVSGNGEPVSLQLSGAPAGVTWSFSISGGFPSFNSNLVLSVASSVPPGAYPIVVSAVGGIASQQVNITLNVLSGKRVFVSSALYSGNLGTLSGADSKCQTLANNASLGGTWKAWLSSTSASASSRLTQSAGPYYLLNGNLLALNWTDLTDGSLFTHIGVDELLNVYEWNSYAVWSNTTITGGIEGTNSGSDACSNWNSNSGTGRLGLMRENNYWTGEFTTTNCSTPQKIYCFEQ